MDAGILPVKRLDRAKQRLLEALGETGRAEVAQALLEDAFALCAAADFLTWWVVSDDAEVLARAADRGFHTVTDPGPGLNEAVKAAASDAHRAGADSVMVIPSDVPLAWSGDLQDLADTGATSDVVLVPARDGGTNGLFMSPPDRMKPRFGPSSFKAHLAEAEKLHLRCSILALPRLEIDIDTVSDIDLYLTRPRHAETATSRVLTRLSADRAPGPASA